MTLTNTGNAPLTIFAITIGGSNPGDFGQTNTCDTTVAAGANCSISVTFKPTASGTRTGTITITDNATASPQMVSLSGTARDFSLGPAPGAPTSATLTAGQSATLNAQVNPINGFTGSANMSCTGAPSSSSCTVSPTTVTVSGSSAAPFSITISTTARSFGVPTTFRVWPQTLSPGVSVGLILLLALAMASMTIVVRSKQIRAWLPAAILLICVSILVTACAGGGSSGGGGSPGTPAGTYTLTLTGTSQGVSRTATVTLTVN